MSGPRFGVLRLQRIEIDRAGRRRPVDVDHRREDLDVRRDRRARVRSHPAARLGALIGDPPVRNIYLHHLHGCLTHFRDLGTGNVFKVAASDLRDHDVFGRLAAAEASDYTPSVILGSRKIEKSQEWPFSYGFLSLERDARAAATIVIAGYSFRDRAVNARLRNLTTPEKRWIVIDRAPTPAAANDFTGAVRDVVGDGQVEFVLDGFGGALPSVT